MNKKSILYINGKIQSRIWRLYNFHYLVAMNLNEIIYKQFCF
jgi:hypothetical protein